jgi:hypothetical protein
VPCPTCGEPVESHQLVCLNCGGRVALKRQPSYASDPMTPIATVLVLVIVIGAGLFGFAISEITSDDGGGGSQVAADGTGDSPKAPSVVSGQRQERGASTETAPTGSGAAAPPAETRAAPTETSPARTAPAAPSAPKIGPNALLQWPRNLTAYTVVLVSSSDHAGARGVARQARRSGLEAGLLRSDDYNLGTGLWIVYTGRFDTREGAARQAAQLDDRYKGAYPQLVKPVG